MEPQYISEILHALRNNFNISPNAEISLETNPGMVDSDKLKNFRATGINRISVGIQSFDEADLKFLTRIHDKEKAINTIMQAKSAGFENINLDLIFNLPGQTKEKWLSNLEAAIKLPVTHISAYSLILESGTILNKMVLDGKVKIQDEDYDADLYEQTIDFLTADGFMQYEVSNFAKPGFECKHNLAYWEYKNYIGFGPSAHSFLYGKRWKNFTSLKKYISEIETAGQAVASSEILTEEQKIEEYVMLALRSSGLNVAEFITLFGESHFKRNQDYFNTLIKANYIKKNGALLSLTPKGYAVCDEILGNIT